MSKTVGSSVVPTRLSHIEPLESRIAPAVLVNGANLLGGPDNPTIGEMSLGDNSVTLVKVTSGQVLVWYNDGAITSISFGDGAAFEILGNVADIVGNLGANGRLSDSDNNPLNGEDGNVLLSNDLAGLKISPFGPQKGNARHVITGGSISNVNIAGQLEGLYAGDGAFHVESDAQDSGSVVIDVGLDTNPLLLGAQPQFTFSESTAVMKGGASIKNVTVGLGKELELIAGNGSPTGAVTPTVAGVAGGSIENFTLKSGIVDLTGDPSTPSYHLIAGDGGSGKTGGAGGSISKITDERSVGIVIFHAGDGGVGLSAKGGDGGSIRSLEMRSDSSHYQMFAGNGGSGAPGGAGGSIVTGNFVNLSPSGGIVKSGDFNGDGAEDVLVVDSSTGNMVVMLHDAASGDFTPAVQYFDENNDPVIVIPGFGTTLSDVAVGDVDNDGDVDFVVAYKDSRNVVAVFNTGSGNFYDSGNDSFITTAATLEGSPAFVGLAQIGGSSALDILVVENQTSQSIVHSFITNDENPGPVIFELGNVLGSYNSEATDFVVGPGATLQAFVSYKNGHVGQIRGTAPLSDTGLVFTGGVSGLDINEDGTQLLALSTDGRSVALYDISGSSIALQTAPTITGSGRGLVAHFVHDADPQTQDQIAILFTAGAVSRIDTFTPSAGANPGDPTIWSAPTSLVSSSPQKNFEVIYADNFASAGFAVLGAAINEFAFSAVGGTFESFSLPFSGKRVNLNSGNGGFGMTIGNLAGKGGAGGAISSINAIATEIQLEAGSGGDSANAAGGAGGSIFNGTSFSLNGSTIVPKLVSDSGFSLIAGSGGSTLAAGGTKATGGAGGGIQGIRGELGSGTIVLQSGNGGNGNGGAGGAGGAISRLDMLNMSGNLSLTAGFGGNALGSTGAGGAGGSVSSFSYELRLESAEALEAAYDAELRAGNGGSSVGGAGGAGGGFSKISIVADPANRSYDAPLADPPIVDAELDSTFALRVFAGNGGNGALGGAGGSSRDLSYRVVQDQKTQEGSVLVSFATGQVVTGQGGNGSAGSGGAGGDFVNGRFQGVSQTDPDGVASDLPLTIVAQGGGNGTTKGGNGGNILGVVASNAAFGSFPSATNTVVGTNMLAGALLTAGDGGNGGTGDGGKGGELGGLKISTQGYGLYAYAGDGGHSTSAKGGLGGGVKDSVLALVSTVFPDGMIVDAGEGGNGATVGGVGGSLLRLNLNGPVGLFDLSGQTTLGRPISLFAGDGGDATASGGKAGAGGDVNGITQAKDVFSTISAILAGNGGDAAAGTGGKGGSVMNVRTVGFIGKPTTDSDRLGLADETGTPQGIFAGHGGAGVIAGVNGSVSSVAARQIAAIAARGASSGTYAPATKVSKVVADLIGYDQDGDGVYDGLTANPGTGLPTDGFLFASSISGVTGNLPAFTFTA